MAIMLDKSSSIWASMNSWLFLLLFHLALVVVVLSDIGMQTHPDPAIPILQQVESINLCHYIFEEVDPFPSPTAALSIQETVTQQTLMKPMKVETLDHNPYLYHDLKLNRIISDTKPASGDMETSLASDLLEFGDEDVDAKVDDFISKFYRHLKLEARLDFTQQRKGVKRRKGRSTLER